MVARSDIKVMLHELIFNVDFSSILHDTTLSRQRSITVCYDFKCSILIKETMLQGFESLSEAYSLSLNEMFR